MKDLIEKITPSFFEVATTMAFWYFAKEEIDIAIIEVGLGGRLDSTNVVNPLISIITNIDMDHQKYLGNTIQEIAAEKAGIIKSGIPCITNNRNEQIIEVLSKKCLSNNSELIKINELSEYKIISKDLDGTSFNLKNGPNIFDDLYLNLPGDHQVENAVLAIGTLLCLKNKLKISEKDINSGLRDVLWKGRINLISREPFIIIDVSHNTSGFERTLSFLNNFFPKERLKVITALQEDKDFEKIGDLLSYYSENVYLVNLKLGKPLLPSKLADVLKQKGVNSKIINSINDIESEIRQLKQKNNFWLIIGSHYLAGEAYQNFKSLDFYN
jgi:dihydrofolate synthase/folylpolyglutamate synthase